MTAAANTLNRSVQLSGRPSVTASRLGRSVLTGARNDPREVVADSRARYFGAELGERSLIPAGRAQLGEIRFQEWLNQPIAHR